MRSPPRPPWQTAIYRILQATASEKAGMADRYLFPSRFRIQLHRLRVWMRYELRYAGVNHVLRCGMPCISQYGALQRDFFRR